MAFTYQAILSGQGIKRSDGASIPFDPANTDCQAFLAWLQAGNVPFQIDGVTPMAAADVQALITQLTPAPVAAPPTPEERMVQLQAFRQQAATS